MYFNPVKLKWGIDVLNRDYINGLNIEGKNILLLTGKRSLEDSGRLDSILDILNEFNIIRYNKINSNPDIINLVDIKKETDKIDYDEIIAIGGGSVLDVGKAISALSSYKDLDYNDIELIIKNKDYSNNRIKKPLLAIPTTSGTGSELTSWATIWDKSNDKKYSIEDYRLYYKNALVDPIFTKELNLELTGITMLDALSHALESYWSIHSNEVTRIYSLESIRLIMKYGSELLQDRENIRLRYKIALASMFAGLAFSNTKTTACHSISYPLTSMYNIPHGLAASMTLFSFLKLNINNIEDKPSLYESFGVSGLEEIDFKIKELYNLSGLNYQLRNFGIKKDELYYIVDKAYTPERMKNNPVEVDNKIIYKVLEEIY